MEFQEFKQAIHAAAAAQGVTEYELYYETLEDTNVGAFRHEINEFTSSVEGGVCFRCLVNGKMGYAATEELSQAAAAALVRRAADNAAALEAEEPEFLGEGGKQYRPVQPNAAPLPTTEQLVAAVLAGLAAQAVAEAKAGLGADVAPTGAYPVVFSPDAMSSLLGTYASVFSSESTQKGLSLLEGKEGTAIASPLVTLVDDPFYKDSAMPMPFDAEGSPTYCKNVIENGVLNTLLYDLKTAAVAGKQTTGNGAKGGYSSKVSVSPFTLYLAPGEMTEEQLLQKAGSGVYINSLGGLHAGANIISGDFSLQSSGFMIENGKKARAVKSFTVAGNFYDLLRQITGVACNVELPMALGVTAYGAPSVLVEGLSIAGK